MLAVLEVEEAVAVIAGPVEPPVGPAVVRLLAVLLRRLLLPVAAELVVLD